MKCMDCGMPLLEQRELAVCDDCYSIDSEVDRILDSYKPPKKVTPPRPVVRHYVDTHYKHGTNWFYERGCRCKWCMESWDIYHSNLIRIRSVLDGSTNKNGVSG